MGLQAILVEVRASGDSQVQEIQEDTQSQVNGILAKAQMEARQIEEDSCEAAIAPAIAERARILHRARLAALRIVGDVREDLVNTAITRTREHLASTRADPSYPEVLRRLTAEALSGLTADGQAQLLADPRDRALLSQILKELGLTLPVSYELSCWGGLIARSQDGRVLVINTLESRLEHVTEFLRSYLAELFEAEEPALQEVIDA